MRKSVFVVLASCFVLGAQTPHPPRHVFSPDGRLSPPSSQPARAIAAGYLRSVAPEYNVTFEDLANLHLVKEYRTSHNGVTHLVYRPSYQDIDVYNVEWTLNIDRDGAIIKYAEAKLNAAAFGAGDTLKLSFTLSNSGKREGDEVVQVYCRHLSSAAPQPKLALCGFKRVHLPAGERAAITMEIPAERFRSWDPLKKQYTVEPGKYELLVGSASDDIRIRKRFSVNPASQAVSP